MHADHSHPSHSLPPALPAVCWATLLSVGLLFGRQVGLLLRGQSYLDALRQRQHWQPHLPGGAAAPVAAAVCAPVGLAPAAQGTAQLAAPPAAAAAAASAAGESLAMQNMRQVFGSGHPLTWLLPAWDVPPAPALASRAKLN